MTSADDHPEDCDGDQEEEGDACACQQRGGLVFKDIALWPGRTNGKSCIDVDFVERYVCADGEASNDLSIKF